MARMRYFVLAALLALAVLAFRGKSDKAPDQEIPTSAALAASPRPASQHDWGKNAIDRAQQVKAQVKRERESNALR